jgi:hypothetical protein
LYAEVEVRALEPRAYSGSCDARVAVGAADIDRGYSMLRIDATQASPLHSDLRCSGVGARREPAASGRAKRGE